MTWLTPGGAAAALVVGAAVAAGIGIRGLALLLAFFVSASLLTRAEGRDPREAGGRTARQVIANGGVAAVAGLAGWDTALAGALAAATADTWATELGRRSRRPPRLITTGTPVAPGTSGGVTVLGTLGGVAGALGLGLLHATLWHRGIILSGPVAIAGVAGMVVDSLLGAGAQARFRCATCGAEYERADPACHGRPVYERGVAWLDNDVVNGWATLVGAGGAAALARGWG